MFTLRINLEASTLYIQLQLLNMASTQILCIHSILIHYTENSGFCILKILESHSFRKHIVLYIFSNFWKYIFLQKYKQIVGCGPICIQNRKMIILYTRTWAHLHCICKVQKILMWFIFLSCFFICRRRVTILEWHPTAENILLSAGFDHRILVWNIAKGQAVNSIECHPDVIYSISLNR